MTTRPRDLRVQEYDLYDRLLQEPCLQNEVMPCRRIEGSKHVLYKAFYRSFFGRRHWVWRCHFCSLQQETPYSPVAVGVPS